MLIWLGKQYLNQSERQIIEDVREDYEVPESLKPLHERKQNTSEAD